MGTASSSAVASTRRWRFAGVPQAAGRACRNRTQHGKAGNLFDLRGHAYARIEADPADQQQQRCGDGEDQSAHGDLSQAHAVRLQRDRGRLLDTEVQAAALGVEVHRQAGVFAALEQVLVQVAVDLEVAGQVRQFAAQGGDAVEAREFLRQQAVAGGDARRRSDAAAAGVGQPATDLAGARGEGGGRATCAPWVPPRCSCACRSLICCWTRTTSGCRSV